ncbi:MULTISPECIES: hypothetical protein [Staphylococcus]|uniref:Phage protein n=1 Tax=Staphylococcus caprae TaxID=29380 RepID=A0ABM7FVM3_9STAP|nr:MULTISPECIES: hypothetical protein [Staphylococcus]MBN6825362.1 hypothetical protein [Staphylococcus caprae]MBU5271180.1 hypothetical protein [Staphylococcus caprae]MBX5315903.1 hypothetical protein [Staphylococcus caprae]MBX5318019.1 hypothetical protein [Staphylococcus caprae]MCI2953618.1 hypothetical protein [Staphylococcus caprae]
MAHNNDNNHMYIIMKHCNEFLERQDDYRTPKTVKSVDESIQNFSESKSIDDDAFTHSGDIFKRAKENLRHKGQL